MVIQKLLLEEGVKRGLKASREYSVSVLGYDFIGLVGRLVVFFLAAFLINAYFQATISGNIWLNSLGSFVGMKFPQSLPQWVTDLFTVGYHNVNFWQIVQIIAIILIILEYTQYDKKLKLQNEKPNATTTAVFAMLALGLSLITFPTIIQKIKEMRIINNVK